MSLVLPASAPSYFAPVMGKPSVQFGASNYQGGRGIRGPYWGRGGGPLGTAERKGKDCWPFWGLIPGPKSLHQIEPASKKWTGPEVEQKAAPDGSLSLRDLRGIFPRSQTVDASLANSTQLVMFTEVA